MTEIISTETTVLTSLWCRKMSGLLQYIYKYSTSDKKQNLSAPISLLSPQQIQEARQHPSAIIQQTLGAAVEIQGALNEALNKLNTLIEQRHEIESVLLKLKALADKKSPENILDENVKKELEKQVIKLRQSEKDLDTITDKLYKEFDNTDKNLLQQVEEWAKHREEYIEKFAARLEAHGLALTSEEKAEMRNDNAAITQRKLKELEKLQISLPHRISSFTIAAYYAVVAALSRTLQKIDNKVIKNLLKG